MSADAALTSVTGRIMKFRTAWFISSAVTLEENHNRHNCTIERSVEIRHSLSDAFRRRQVEETVDEVINVRREMTVMLAGPGFAVRKWCIISESKVLMTIPEEERVAQTA